MQNRFVALFCALMVLAACGSPAPEAPPATADSTTEAAIANWAEPFTPIRRENADQMRLLGRLDSPQADSGTVFSHAFSLDGTRLAVLNQEELLGWDLLSGRLLVRTSRLEANHVYYSPDKTQVYTVNDAGGVRVYNGETGVQVTQFDLGDDYNGVHAYHDGTGQLAAASTDGSITVWDALQQETLDRYDSGMVDAITALRFSPLGSLLAGGSATGEVAVWVWNTETEQMREAMAGGTPIEGLVFSPLGVEVSWVAAANADTVTAWEIDTGEAQYTLDVGDGGAADVLAYMPNMQAIVTSGTTDTMVLWDATTGERVTDLLETGGEPAAVAFNVLGDLMLSVVFQQEAVLWDVINVGEGVGQGALGAEGLMVDVAWSLDGRTVALFEAAGPVQVWGIPQAQPTDTPDDS